MRLRPSASPARRTPAPSKRDQAERVRAYFKGDRSSATVRPQADAKPKVDLSGVSKPGDAMRAILERRNAQANPPVVAAAAPKVVAPPAPVVSRPAPPVVSRPAVTVAPPPVRPAVVAPAPIAAVASPRCAGAPCPRTPAPAPAPAPPAPAPAAPTPPVVAPRRIVPLPNQGARIIAQPPAAPAIASRAPAGPVVAKAPPTHFVPSVFGKPTSTTPVVVAAPPKPLVAAPSCPLPPRPLQHRSRRLSPLPLKYPHRLLRSLRPRLPPHSRRLRHVASSCRRRVRGPSTPRPAPAPGAAPRRPIFTRPGGPGSRPHRRTRLASSHGRPLPARAGRCTRPGPFPLARWPGRPRRRSTPRLHSRRTPRLPCASGLSPASWIRTGRSTGCCA